MLAQPPSPVTAIIGHDNQAWLHNHYIKNYQVHLSGTVHLEYHQLTGLPPIRSFINNSGDNEHNLHFITVDNQWINLNSTQGIIECMTDVLTVVRNLECTEEPAIIETSYIVTLDHKLLKQDNE